MPQRARRPFRAEPREVIPADLRADVLILAIRAVLTESTPIPGTLAHSRIGLYVKEHALIVVADAVYIEEKAFWHLSKIVFVKELAPLILLAQASQPVLADDGRDKLYVLVWAAAVVAAAFLEERAVNRARDGVAESIGDERLEVKVEGGVTNIIRNGKNLRQGRL